MAGSFHQALQPMSVKEISAKATDYEFNPFIPLKYWLRTADTLLREARIYEQEYNDQQAYLLLMRYASLVAEKFPTHPSARNPEYKAEIRASSRTLPPVLERLELLKPRVNARYDAYQKALERRRNASAALEGDLFRPSSRNGLAASDPAVAGNITTLGAAENSQLAVKLAHREIRRRDAARRSTRQAGVSEQEEQERRTAGLWDDWEAALSKDGQSQEAQRIREDDDMRRNMEATRRQMDLSQDASLDGASRKLSKPPRPARPSSRSGSEYRYPSISKSQPLSYDQSSSIMQSRLESPQLPHLPPKPPKQHFDDPPEFEAPPAVPEKTAGSEGSHMADSKPPSSFTFRPSAYLESGKPLRTVFLPPTLRERFLQIAAPNTRRNLETCGVLCGTLISNALFISKVVIPEQEATSDTCDTVNEGALFDYCAKEDLMVLGWIHTHPTQTCFMSSRDLHTHSGYQTMMAESIAIVCAPSKTPSWGIFRLTDPPGLKCVLHCQKPGLFHEHDAANIYTDALRPGHVFEAEGLEYEVVDLRP